MKFTLLASVLLTSTLALAQPSPQRGGVSSEWDVRKLLESLDLQTQHLKPIIERIKPETWVANGAPEGYAVQWKTGQAELRYLLASSEALFRQTVRFLHALDTYFHILFMA